MARIPPEARLHLETFKGVKVRHPRLEEVDAAVSQAIEEHAGYTHVLLCGPSGVGKSTVTRRIAERFLAEETNRAVVPVVWVEARPADTGTYARLDYYRQVLSALREHVAVKDRLMNLALSPDCLIVTGSGSMRLCISVTGGGTSWRSPVTVHCDTFRTLVD